MKTTLFYWVFRQARYVVCLVLTLMGIGILMGGYFEGMTENVFAVVFLLLVWLLIWYKEHQHRERVRGLIRARIGGAYIQWKREGRPWTRPDVPMHFDYVLEENRALSAALSRPDLWGSWTLNVYNGETDRPFATGNNDLWPRWVFEPVKG